MLPDDPSQVEYLYRRLLEANPLEMEVLRDSLSPYQGALKKKLWEDLSDARTGDPRILPVAGVLSMYAPEDSGWADLADKVAGSMVKAKFYDVPGWRVALASVREKLITPLARIFRESAPDHTEHELATELLADYAANNPRFLVEVMLDADPKAFSIFLDVIRKDRTAILVALENELNASGGDPTTAPSASVVPSAAAKDGHQPSEGDPAAARRSARRGRAAVALVRLGDDKDVWKLLEHRKDPEVRSHLINALSPYGAEPSILARELERLGEGGEEAREGTLTSSIG